MSIDLKLGDGHDLAIENFDLVVLSNVEQVIQHINIRLKFFLGEWFLDITIGIPYYRDVLIKGFDVGTVEAVFKDQILGTPGVTKISEFDLVLESTRVLTVSFKAVILDEEVTVEVTV